MEILPAEYQQQDLSRTEKMFVRYAENESEYGYLILNTNAAMIQGEKQHIAITSKGILLVKFFDSFDNPDLFETVMGTYFSSVYENTFEIVNKKLLGNKALVGNDGKLVVGFNYICVFPNLSRPDTNGFSESLAAFTNDQCAFKEDFADFKKMYETTVNKFVSNNGSNLSENSIQIDEKNINAILQRIAPEYTTIRVSGIEDRETFKGVDNELLVVTDDDIAVKAFMLDSEQINIVNKILKGDQLILACAGSGKSVILIAKCFKAARMNPDKKFLITCKSKQLQSLYTWYIDRAGLKERNVECYTFHKLCQRLAEHNGLFLPSDIDEQPNATISHFNKGRIKDRYYGIFIDEVQQFDQEWYKLCYNLLENKESGEHIFIICGDKTQEIAKKQKRGIAPWNVGEGYPNYRGGNKSIRIEKNYRNCVEVNNYINRFVTYAKMIYGVLPGNEVIDPDMFLRGKAIRTGIGAYVRKLNEHNSKAEAELVIKLIHEAHDKYFIPYDEIAVVTYNKLYRKKMQGWSERKYDLETPLLGQLESKHIPYSIMYSGQNMDTVRYGANDGVALISIQSVLGLDFRAVIVCGLKPLGDYDGTKIFSKEEIQALEPNGEMVTSIKDNISNLYVACTRARDILYIVQPEEKTSSIYMEMLINAVEEE